MNKFYLFKLCLFVFGASLVAPSANADMTMVCPDVPGYSTPRYYKLEESFGKQSFLTRLGGEWIEICTSRYMPVNETRRTRKDDGSFTVLNLKSEIRDKAIVCNAEIMMEKDNSSPYTYFAQWIIDFELTQYQIRSSKTSDFSFQSDFDETIRNCEIR